MKRAAIVVAVLAVVGGGWYWHQHGPCGKETVWAEVSALNREQSRFRDGLSVLDSTPVMLASQQVKTLYDIKRDVEVRAVPPCLAGAKSDLVSWMGSVIETANLQIQSLMGPLHTGLPEETMRTQKRIMDGFSDAYKNQTGRAIECAPFCG